MPPATEIENRPDLWRDRLPRPAADGHKYDRGHAVVLAAPDFTGATRLAAEAASRIGAGLVGVLAATRADVYRAALPPDIMVHDGPFEDINRPNVALAGPGGLSAGHRTLVEDPPTALSCMVCDADALPVFRESARRPVPTVITPHAGEFARIFPGLSGAPRDRTLAAAAGTGAVVVHKGPETLIADADGRLVVNRHASRWLAKAGTGDVLAGMIAGLAAQGLSPFDAACAAVWMHGEAGRRIGPGLVASDIASHLGDIYGECIGCGSPTTDGADQREDG